MAYRVGMANVVVGLALLAFWLYCLFDVITTPPEIVRTLPKAAWVLVVMIPAMGGVLWLLAGRPVPEPITPGQNLLPSPPPPAPRGPDDDPDFLRSLERKLREED